MADKKALWAARAMRELPETKREELIAKGKAEGKVLDLRPRLNCFQRYFA